MNTIQPNEPATKLGNQAKTIRHQKGLTQEQLAQKANVSRSFIIEFENGHPRAELGKVIAVMHALGTELLATPRTPTAAELIAEEKTAAFADILNSKTITIDETTRTTIEQYIAGKIEIDEAYNTIAKLQTTN